MSHHNTVFSQLLKLVPGYVFEHLAHRHHAGRLFRTASRWSQFLSMAMAQLARRNSLRDIVETVATQAHRFYHLGSAKLSRSNLSRINDAKPYELYEAVFGKLLARCQGGVVPGHDFRFKHPLYSLDASTIDVCLSIFPWADFRTTKGAIKLHVGLNHAGYLPVRLRRIGYRDVITGKRYVFLTNKFRLSASTIAGIYKARCQVELFFKWIKQNLKIKSFVGTSKNAVMTQIWIAMCVYLILAFIKFRSRLTKSLKQTTRLLQLNLFEEQNLMSVAQR